jgi:cation diffusion facilitator CzcD-associated flavoprotein CzcO
MVSIASVLPPGPWFQTRDAWQWLFLLPALAALPVALGAARRHGIERLTGMPAWAGAAVWLSMWALGVAFFGFMWDVTWHADLGRDLELFTVPHVLILAGLGGIGAAFLAAVALASRDSSAPGLRAFRLRVPVSAVPLGLLAAGALAGFPLDDYWHAVYGIDVTMWSPTHLLMIGAASLTPIAVWLMLREAGVHERRGHVRRLWLLMPGIVLVGLSTFQLEFDLGIPQWQLLYQPLLIAGAMAIALTAARVVVGRGGALLAAAGFIAMRAFVAAALTVGLGRGLAHFPLTVAEALCVEAAFLLPRLSVPARAVAGGLLVATAGLAAELGWTHLWYALTWGPELLPSWWMDVAMAMAGALLGAALGNVAAGRRAGLPAPAAAAAMLVVGVLLGLHLPLRHADPANVTLAASPAGPARLETTRQGVTLPEQPVWLHVTVSPAAEPDGADWFGIIAWQGGAPVQHATLLREAPGRYRASGPVPAGGGWKTLVIEYRGDVLEAAPVAMPPDFQYGLPQVDTPLSARSSDFVPASRLLTREAHGGPWWPAAPILAFFGLMAVVWAVALAAVCARLSAVRPGPPRAGEDGAGAGEGRRPRAVIVGSGFSGLGMAIRLKQAGIDDFVVLEKASDLGGTWRDNRYPGCACDIPSHLYSFSFAPSPCWTRKYPPADEIWAYMRRCAEQYGVVPHIRFETEMTGAELDPAGGGWRVHTRAGETFDCQALILAMGPLHQPMYPAIPGLERFGGRAFHSSDWDAGCDLTGRRVAVIGTGASAIQLVPQVAPRAATLHVFQRTPPWVLPRGDRPVAPWQRWLFRVLPVTQRAVRTAIYWSLELRVLGFSVNPGLMRLLQRLAVAHLHRQVADPELRRALTPGYTLGCKRVLLSDDYYPAFSRANVELVTSGISEVREDRIVTSDGVERPVDVIVFGTGFHVTDAMANVTVVGRDGLRIQDAWRDGMEAYLGTTVAGFPNLFLVLGPNTGLGHNSMVFMIEAQTRYVLQCLRMLRESGRAELEVRPPVQSAFNRRIQERLRRAVWSVGGCASWYLDASGTNRTLWPGSSFRYWLRTRRARTADYGVDVP